MNRLQWGVCVVVSVIAAWYGQQGLRETFQDQNHYLTSGITAPGRVIRTRTHRSSLEMVYVFVVNDTEQLGSYSGNAGDCILGQRITIRYLPDNPLQSQVVGHEGYGDLYSIYGVLFASGCTGLFFLTRTFLRQRERSSDFTELTPSVNISGENTSEGVKLQQLPAMPDIAIELNPLPSDRR